MPGPAGDLSWRGQPSNATEYIIISSSGVHYVVGETPTAAAVYLHGAATRGDEADLSSVEAALELEEAISACGADSLTAVIIHAESRAALPRLGSVMQRLPRLSRLEIITTAATMNAVQLGQNLNQLKQLQHLYLDLQPGTAVPDPSQGALLAAGLECFQRLDSLHLRAEDVLMKPMWSWLQELTQLRGLEVSPHSGVTAEQLQRLAGFPSMTRLVFLGLPSRSSGGDSYGSVAFKAAGALPTLPGVISGGGEVPVGDVPHLVRVLPNAQQLELDLHCETLPAPAITSSSSSGSGVISTPSLDQVKQALLLQRSRRRCSAVCSCCTSVHPVHPSAATAAPGLA